MRNKSILIIALLPSLTYPKTENQMPVAQKAEIAAAEQQQVTDQSNPAINLNFTVSTSNSQDARAQNTTTATTTQTSIKSDAPQAAVPPQVIIIQQEKESITRSIFLSLFSAGAHLGVAVLTGKIAPAAAPAKAILPPLGLWRSNNQQTQRIIELVKNYKK